MTASTVPTTSVEKDPRLFLSSHRARSIWTREFERVVEETVERVSQLRGPTSEKIDLRMMPGRCIMQLGAVALTFSCLRSPSDSAADGRLLIVAWQGKVAHGMKLIPERPAHAPPVQTAVAIWEEAFVANATQEADWRWMPESGGTRTFAAGELAARCTEPLRMALTAQ